MGSAPLPLRRDGGAFGPFDTFDTFSDEVGAPAGSYDLWSTANIQGFSGAVVGAGGVFLGAAVPAGGLVIGWQGVNIAGHYHRFRITSSGPVGNCRIVGSNDNDKEIVAPFAIANGQDLDLIIPVPSDEPGWALRATTGLSAGSLTAPNLVRIG